MTASNQFTYGEFEPQWDDGEGTKHGHDFDVGLRDRSGDSFYFHFAAIDSVSIFIGLVTLVESLKYEHHREALDRMKDQLANQGIDWDLFREMLEKDFPR